jgi:aromatic-L-amino-acid/L-tryptophan decarboxylase
MGNIHPRFWAWYMGNGTVFGALAEFMAAIMNPNLAEAITLPIWSKNR